MRTCNRVGSYLVSGSEACSQAKLYLMDIDIVKQRFIDIDVTLTKRVLLSIM